MQGWQTTFLGMRELPHDLSTFELQAFFTFGRAEHELIQSRRGDSLRLGLALHIGFPIERYAEQPYVTCCRENGRRALISTSHRRPETRIRE
jgi:hypothetical protein